MKTEYEQVISVWNALYWISLIGMLFTISSIGAFTYFGAVISKYLWFAVVLYLVGAIYSIIIIKALKDEHDQQNR